MGVAVALLLLFGIARAVHAANNSTTLTFLLMVTSGSSPDSSAIVSAVDKTLEAINRHTSIIPAEYRFNYTLKDINVRKNEYV